MARQKDAHSPVVQVNVRDFSGMVTNSDEFDLPDGAAVEQKNVTCIVAGALTTRPGIREVIFED